MMNQVICEAGHPLNGMQFDAAILLLYSRIENSSQEPALGRRAMNESLRDELAHELHRTMCCSDPEKVVVDGFKEAADELMPWLQHKLDRMKFIAHEAGWDAATEYMRVARDEVEES